MASLDTALSRLQDGLHLAKDDKSFSRVASHFAKQIGYKWFAYFRNEKDFNVISSYPKEWQSVYKGNNYQDIDPIIRKAAQTRINFDWVSPETILCRKKRKFFGEAADFGIRSGIVIPLRSGLGRQTAMTFIGDHKDGLKVDDDRHIDAVYRASVFFDTYFDMSNKKENKIFTRLSVRERECLTWLSRGKMINEIAIIMNVTERTLNQFIFNFKKKLNASTIPHAVTLAIGLGEIEIIKI